jgi:hypothetical protein
MKSLVKPMLPAAALFAACLFAASARAATEPPDPCSLLTPAQLAGVLRATYTGPSKSEAPRPYPNSGPGTDCRYKGRNDLMFRIYFDGSAGDATALFAKVKPFFAPNTEASGIGDEAYFDNEGALHVRKGNVRFYLNAGTNKLQDALTKLGGIVAGQL